MIKKIVAITMVAAAVLLLAACGDTPNVPTVSTTTAAAPSAEIPQTTAPTPESTGKPVLGVGDRDDFEEDPTETGPQQSAIDATVSDTTPEASQPGSTPPEDTQPGSNPPEDTQPGSTPPEGQTGMTYAEYNAMTGEEQEEFADSFPTLRDFINWFNKAKAEAEEDKDYITGDPNIDLGDLVP